ncbi:MAG: glycosyltransferase [Deltaproteobacteria bacterium]|nr:glycosyltransferase [Deltaproteobacteria bacterium]
MNIHIITSSYPAYPDDPTGTAGLFVRQFALELANCGHSVVVQPAARKSIYEPDPGISVIPTPWSGGDQELASMNLMNPINWLVFILFFIRGIINTQHINNKYKIERTLCVWAVPSGIFGLAGKIRHNVPYDIWALGSDIWKIRKIPLLGKLILKIVTKNADRVYADGFQLCKDVNDLTGKPCEFLPSSRKLPPPNLKVFSSDSVTVKHFLFVGRYHLNKGPDILIKAIACLPHALRESLQLHMFGFGPLKGDLERMISELKLEKYIDLHGPIRAQEFSNYLDSVSFFVIPSRIESFPIVFSDALQLGTPVVSMPVGDLEGFIREYKCGIVAKVVTPEALAAAIQEALLRDKECFRENIAKAYQRFDMGNSINKWLDLGSTNRP